MLLYHLPCHPLDHRPVSAIELCDERESTPMSEANPSKSADAKLGREIATMACEDVALISIALEAAAPRARYHSLRVRCNGVHQLPATVLACAA